MESREIPKQIQLKAKDFFTMYRYLHRYIYMDNFQINRLSRQDNYNSYKNLIPKKN